MADNKFYSFNCAIENRRIFVLVGKKTQTVNFCTGANRRGDYDCVFRLNGPESFVSEPETLAHQSITSLKAWLIERGAVDEGSRTDQSSGQSRLARTVPVVPAPVVGDEWLADAARITEAAIDSLVWEFVQHPYLHRVEHSLHVRLYGIMTAHPLLSESLPIGRSGFCTQPLHKEWPETVPRESKEGGRGNFDLAVLSRDQLANASLEQFRGGRIAAAIVIEMGLDYGPKHLTDDHHKLLNSTVEAGYLVHLTRTGARNSAVEDLILHPQPPLKTAYAYCDPCSPRVFKTLNATTIRSADR